MEKTSKGAFTYNPDILKKGSVIKFSMGGLYKGHAYFRVMGFNGDHAKLLYLTTVTDSSAAGQYQYSGIWPTQGTTGGLDPVTALQSLGKGLFSSDSNKLTDITWKDSTGTTKYNGIAYGFDTDPASQYGPINGIHRIYNGLNLSLKDKILMSSMNGVMVSTSEVGDFQYATIMATIQNGSLIRSVVNWDRTVPSSFSGLGVSPLTIEDITSYFGTSTLKGQDIATKLFGVSKIGRTVSGQLFLSPISSGSGDDKYNMILTAEPGIISGVASATIGESSSNGYYLWTMWLDLAKTRNHWEVDESYPGLE